MIEGTKNDSFFSWEAGDILGKVWWPEVGRTLGGTFYGSGDKQNSVRPWVIIDGAALVRVPLSQALLASLPFAVLRQPNGLEAVGASGIF